MPDSVVVQADGGSRGNPGPAGYGAVVFAEDSGEVLAEAKDFLGTATNNVAEYSGLVAGLTAATEIGARQVAVQMDSKLVVEQMRGRWQVKHPALRELRDQAQQLARGFDQISYDWIPRERNKHADRLANEAMDSGTGVQSKPKKQKPAPVDTAPAPSWTPLSGTPTRLILARHGATEHSARHVFSGRNDLELTTDGVAQAQALRTRLRRVSEVAAVLSSPITRAAQTAGIVAEPAQIRVLDNLAEIDFGEWEGLTADEIADGWPQEFAAFRTGESPAPNGESFADVARRLRAARTEILAAYPAQTVVLVTHVTPIKTLVASALDAPSTALFHLHLDIASVSVIDYFADGQASVRLVNDTSHLDHADKNQV